MTDGYRKATKLFDPTLTITPLSPADPSSLKGHSVLVKGGTSGLGLSAATFLAQSGASVTVVGRRDCYEITCSLSAQGYNVQFARCDINNWDSQVAAFRAALDFSPNKTLDPVAAFAAIGITGHIVDGVSASGEVSLDGPPPSIPNLNPIEVNFKGTFYTARLALRYLRLPIQGQPPSTARTPAAESKSLTLVSSNVSLHRRCKRQCLSHVEMFEANMSVYLGRAIVIMPEGAVDLGDDIEGCL
ncbi:uncharacterized protein BDV17DRAFT_294688 [Aspergillus undulatus]|uniref:uncharacterized protein n=1 Tax=Aspergillus undulatus TaxID=1810928 RepID=UPI003CCCFB45